MMYHISVVANPNAAQAEDFHILHRIFTQNQEKIQRYIQRECVCFTLLRVIIGIIVVIVVVVVAVAVIIIIIVVTIIIIITITITIMVVVFFHFFLFFC